MAFGSPLDLGTLGAGTGFRMDGRSSFSQTGIAVASAGDVNGDGHDDVIVGANTAGTPQRPGAGAAFVVFGGASGPGPLDLASIGTRGFAIEGANAQDETGLFVAGAGDVNGDGYADILVGAAGADTLGRTDNGATYLVFGRAGGFGTLDLAQPGTAGIRIHGASSGDFAAVVAGAGDVNGDGFADLLIGAPGLDEAGLVDRGAAYVVFGRAAGWADLDLAQLGARGFRILGAEAGHRVGLVLSPAGDFNGDGLADIALGAPEATVNGQANTGSVWVVAGRTGGAADVDLTNEAARIDGAAPDDFTGSAVAGAGDVNADGFGDLLIGAPGADPGGKADAGSASIVFGRAAAKPLNLGALGTAGVRFDGVAPGDMVGMSVAGAGDVNGDGHADALIGAEGASPFGSGGLPGNTYVIPGRPSWDPAVDLGAYWQVGERIDGAAPDDRAGRSAGAGDVNGDGFADVIIGGTGVDTNGRSMNGAAYVAFSQATGGAYRLGTRMGDSLSGGTGSDTMLGAAGQDLLRGRGGDDALFGGPGHDALEGGAGNDLLNGAAGLDAAVFAGPRAAHTLTKNQGPGWLIAGPEGTDTLVSVERLRFADGVLPLGQARPDDMAGRGFADILFRHVAGGWLYRWEMEGATRTGEGALTGPGANWTLAGKGDLDGDGRSDLVWRQEGTGFLYAWLMDGGTRVAEGSVGTLAAGESVAGVGDMDGDGRADLLLRGADGGWTIQRMDGATVLGRAAGTLDAAWHVAAVADFNGDMRSDILWRHAGTGQLYLWQMNGTTVASHGSYATPGTGFTLAAAADLDGDGRADTILRHESGWLGGYLTDPTTIAGGLAGFLGAEIGGFALAAVADFTGDDRADLLFQHLASGGLWLQGMSGFAVTSAGGAGLTGGGFALL